MLSKFSNYLFPIGMSSLITSIPLWLFTITRQKLSTLTLSTPFWELGTTYSLGLFIIFLAFFLINSKYKPLSLFIIAIYTIATLSFIYPYPVMHDSLRNVILFPNVKLFHSLYGQSYMVLGVIVNILLKFPGINAWNIAQYFPLVITFIYFFALLAFIFTWRHRLISSSFSGHLFIFFIFIFGATFNLRINLSPQTIGFVTFLIAMTLLPLSSKSVIFRFLLLITLTIMIMSHPISPLLAFPGIVIGNAFLEKINTQQLKRSFGLGITFITGYITWTLYQADWVINEAFLTFQNALNSEKSIPLTQSPINTQVKLFIFSNRLFLILLLSLLIVCYICLFRQKIWFFATVWGIAFIPAFFLLLGQQNFFDRILLYLLIPSAIIFAEAINLLHLKYRMLTIPAYTLILALSLLSSSVSYFPYQSVDRITQDEVNALNYLKSLERPLVIYSGGFNVPLSTDMFFLPASRGIINMEDVSRADTIVITQQLRNATILSPFQSTSMKDLEEYLVRDYVRVFTSGNTEVYLK